MKHLFKLKKDGKTVGYMQLQQHDKLLWYLGMLWRYSADGKTKWTGQKAHWPTFDEAHPFVTTDKNGKDVFEGDKVYVFNNKTPLRVIWSATHRGWAVQLDKNPEGLPMSFSSFYPKDIELIKEKL